MKSIILSLTLFLSMMVFADSASANNCTVLMKNRRGMTVDTFNAWGYNRADACRQAKSRCQRAIWNGHRRRGASLKCEVARRSTGNGHYITRQCSTSLIRATGRVIQYFSAHVQGPRTSGVKRQACKKALRKCNRFKQRRGYYRARCINNESNPPVEPPRRNRRGLISE